MLRFHPVALSVVLFVSAGTVAAQSAPATPAVSSPLIATPVHVRTQPLATGAVTHQVTLPVAEGDAPVTVRSIQPDSVTGNYRINFDALDVDGDGFISRDEAHANPALADEFTALDTQRRGRLDRSQLAGWLLD